MCAFLARIFTPPRSGDLGRYSRITSLRAKDDYALPPVPRPSFALDGRFFIESILSAGEGVYPDLPEGTRLARKAESIHSRKKS